MNYLLDQLIEIGAVDIVREINEMLSSGKTVIASDDIDLAKNKIKKSQVGKTQIQAYSDEESLKLALDYLKKTLIDVPKYTDKIMEHFGDNVKWRKDGLWESEVESVDIISESSSLYGRSQEFLISDFQLDDQKMEMMKVSFKTIKRLLKK